MIKEEVNSRILYELLFNIVCLRTAAGDYGASKCSIAVIPKIVGPTQMSGKNRFGPVKIL